MAYEDAKHRPHAVHTGEIPENIIEQGPYALSVRLDCFGPSKAWATTMCDALQSNWGDEPSRSWMQPCRGSAAHSDNHTLSWEHESGWCQLTDDQRRYVEMCFEGKTLQQVLEMFSFTFTIDGVARAFTHEFVRARIGSGFMQHGGRDNDWRHRKWTMPETIRRAVNAHRAYLSGLDVNEDPQGRKHAITNWDPIEALVKSRGNTDLLRTLVDHIADIREVYAALVDAGIPWQDARRLLPIGMQTYIHGMFNFVALKGVLANRLEHIMDWEINCVAQLMQREVILKCPPMFGKALGSHSDFVKSAKFERLESWPPDGKWPGTTMRCKMCGHAEGNHTHVGVNYDPLLQMRSNELHCEVCAREGGSVAPIHNYVAEDTLPRQHRREQMPFFVLDPECMRSGHPVKWLWTNGNYQDIFKQER